MQIKFSKKIKECKEKFEPEIRILVDDFFDFLGLKIPKVEKWIRFGHTKKYAPNEKIVFTKTSKYGHRYYSLSYISNKGNVYIWEQDKEIKLPKETKCYGWATIPAYRKSGAIRRELKKRGIHYTYDYGDYNDDTELEFIMNFRKYRILDI